MCLDLFSRSPTGGSRYGRFSFLPGHWTDSVMPYVEDKVITVL